MGVLDIVWKIRSLRRKTACVILLFASNCMCTFNVKVPKFSTKTPYHWVTGSRDQASARGEAFEGCVPFHLNYLIRHGARDPSAKDVKKFSSVGSAVIKELKSSKEHKFHPLMEWSNQFIGKDKELIELGRKEQLELGGRIGQQFKDLLSSYDSTGLQFVVSSKSRTKDSAVSFYQGLMPALGHDITSDEGMVITLSDETLRFFDNCDKYLTDVDNNKGALAEYKKFLNSDTLIELASKVSKRLELKNLILTPGELRIVFYLCSIETTVFNSSDWCHGLEEEDLIVLEYLMDLKHYWKKAYGYSINYLQSCPLTQDIMGSLSQALRKYQKGDQYLTGLFRFGHAETILPLYSILGMYNDTVPLRADNFHLHQNRKFLTSHICPFSANIGFVLYDCEERMRTVGDITERFAISVLVNEVPVNLPNCNSALCSLGKFQDMYSHLSGCDFSRLCFIDNVQKDSRDEL